MSHVDEGALHAYLDGALDEYPTAEAARIRAHLDDCAECARRLEEERAVRSAAHGILALAAPAVEAPSFEELRAYVRRTRPEGRGTSKRVLRMRWAASVVLALGTGWLLRGGIPGPAADAGFEAPPVVTTGSGAAGTPASPARDETAVSSADAGGEVLTTARPAEADETTAAVPSPDEAQPAEAPTLADRASVEAAPAADARGDDAVATSGLDAGVAAPSVTASAPTGVPDASAEPGLPAAARTATPESRVAPVPAVTALAGRLPAPGESQDSAPASTPSNVDEDRTRSARTDVPVVSAMDRTGATALRASTLEEEVTPTPGSPGLTVPGYAVVSITNLGQGTEWQGVQAVQRLESGSTFEVYHLEPEIDRSVVPPPADGVGEVQRLTEDGWIVLQGPLPQADLEALLARLLGEADEPQG